MKKYFSLFWLGSIILLTSVIAHGQTFNLSLTGTQENPGNNSPAVGSATVILNQAASTLSINMSFSGLTGNSTASHIHCCAGPGVNGMVATTTPTFAGFPLGVTAGTFNIVLDLNNSTSYNPAFVTAHGNSVPTAKADFINGILGGQTYLNVHSSTFMGGEIRAQLVPDTTAPSITCPSSLTKFVDPGQVTALATIGAPVANDNVGVASIGGTRSDGQPLSAPFPLGITIITWTATDTSGNTATCFQSVGVMVPSGGRRNP